MYTTDFSSSTIPHLHMPFTIHCAATERLQDKQNGTDSVFVVIVILRAREELREHHLRSE